MTASRLAALLDQATPGVGPEPTWTMVPHSPVDLKLDEIALDMARLLVDMAVGIRGRCPLCREGDRPEPHPELGGAAFYHGAPYSWHPCQLNNREHALLARFAALDEKAGGA